MTDEPGDWGWVLFDGRAYPVRHGCGCPQCTAANNLLARMLLADVLFGWLP